MQTKGENANGLRLQMQPTANLNLHTGNLLLHLHRNRICKPDYVIIMDIVSRLKTFIDYLGVPVTQFADNCGIPRPTLSQLLNGRNKTVRDELISKIHAAYPRLSVMWLMFGEGEAILDAPEAVASPQSQAQAGVAAHPHAQSRQGAMNYSLDDAAGLFDEPDYADAPKRDSAETGTVQQAPIDFSFDLPPQHDNGANLTPSEAAAMTTHEVAATPLRDAAPKVAHEVASSAHREAAKVSHETAAKATSGMPPVGVRSEAATSEAQGSRRVVSIIVYYSDSSYQAFVPDDDGAPSLPSFPR